VNGIESAIDGACALHARFGVETPWDLCVEPTAAALGGYVIYDDIDAGADARVVRADGVALIYVAVSQRGTPRARFSIAHEMGHLVLHPDVDALARVHGLPRATRAEHDVERQANAFASEWLLPRALFAPMCCVAQPTLDDVARIARIFGTSLTATAKRWTQLSPAACALVEYSAGRVRHFDRSASFLAKVVLRRHREDRAWADAAKANGLSIAEETIDVPGTDVALAWLSHA
jgi:hypothetical protein